MKNRRHHDTENTACPLQPVVQMPPGLERDLKVINQGTVIRLEMHPGARARDAIKLQALELECFARKWWDKINAGNLRHLNDKDAGGNVCDLQLAMGHKHLDTTQGYVHSEGLRVVSPLDARSNVVPFTIEIQPPTRKLA